MRNYQNAGILAIFAALSGWLLISCAQRENAYKTMTTSLNATNGIYTDTAVFGSGCFWCSEAVFELVEGVLKVTSGYSGGHVKNPTYEQIGEKNTGHAEVIEIVYNPAVVSYEELLEIFWQTHDPTTPNQQGNDVGPQYRSVVFYKNDDQKQMAEHYKSELDKSGSFNNAIVTEISPLINFYEAEKYHQDYYANNSGQPYCNFVIRPKMEKFRKVFEEKLKK